MTRVIEDVLYHLGACQSAVCVGWHAAMAVGSFALGLWMANEVFRHGGKSADGSRGISRLGFTRSLRSAFRSREAGGLVGNPGVLRPIRPAQERPKSFAGPHPEPAASPEMVELPREDIEVRVVTAALPRRSPPTESVKKDEREVVSALPPSGQPVIDAPPRYLKGRPRAPSADRERLFAAAMAALGVDDTEWETASSAPSWPPFGNGTAEEAEVSATEAVESPDPVPSVIPAPEPSLPSDPAGDDLTLVRGINRTTEGLLRDAGITSYETLGGCPAERWEEIVIDLGLGNAAREGRWRDQARELERHTAAIRGIRSIRPPREIAPALLEGWFAGEDVRNDPRLGYVYGALPEVVDRLTDIPGLTAELAAALGRIGIHRFKQVAHWTDDQVEEIAERLAVPRLVIDAGAWMSHALLLHLDAYRGSPIWTEARPESWRYEELLNQYPAEDRVQTDERFGVVYLEPPPAGDDLTRVESIDPALAEWLQACGVHRYQQIADWSEANVEAFAARLDLPPGRIFSEGWIARAGLLVRRSRAAANAIPA